MVTVVVILHVLLYVLMRVNVLVVMLADLRERVVVIVPTAVVLDTRVL